MKKVLSENIYAFGLYAGLPLALLPLQYIAALILSLVTDIGVDIACGLQEGSCALHPASHDAPGFLFLTVTTALFQFFWSSLLVFDIKRRSVAVLMMVLSGSLTCWLFAALSARSNFSGYQLSYLPIAAAFLLGGLPAIFQKPENNPCRDLSFKAFRL